MITKCKKCGCDALIKNGEWYECPKCGAMMFDVSDFIGEKSPTKMLQMLDEENVTIKEQSRQPDTINIIFKENDDAKSVADSKKPKKEKNKNKKSKKNNTAKNNEEKQKKSKLREAISFMTPIVVALIIAIFLKTCIFANIVIPTGSMLNTIQEGDRIIASRLAYINDEPQRYDIIIFKYPDDETQLFAKRIIALPGETIEVKNGIVYITDKNGNKSTARTDFITNCIPTGNFGPYTVPLGSYFVMGDNRNNSLDSRYPKIGLIHRDEIISTYLFTVFG